MLGPLHNRVIRVVAPRPEYVVRSIIFLGCSLYEGNKESVVEQGGLSTNNKLSPLPPQNHTIPFAPRTEGFYPGSGRGRIGAF